MSFFLTKTNRNFEVRYSRIPHNRLQEYCRLELQTPQPWLIEGVNDNNQWSPKTIPVLPQPNPKNLQTLILTLGLLVPINPPLYIRSTKMILMNTKIFQIWLELALLCALVSPQIFSFLLHLSLISDVKMVVFIK